MKKIFFVVLVLFFLSSCGNSQEKIDAAKQALLEQEAAQTATGEIQASTTTGEELKEDTQVLQEAIEIVEYGQNPVLKFNTLTIDDFLDGEAEITGETLGQVDSIEVTFSNSESSFPEDTYILQTFTS